MSKPKSLTRRQRAVIEDFFADKADEQTVLNKHHVTRSLYDRWLADEHFQEAIEKRIAQAHLAGRVVLARSALQAATKLVNLTQQGTGETLRKACLDIIASQPTPTPGPPASEAQPRESEVITTPLPPETASRILAILAEGRQGAGN